MYKKPENFIMLELSPLDFGIEFYVDLDENQVYKTNLRRSVCNGGYVKFLVDPDEILTYEEVTRYYPQPNRKRPIILIGPPDVGRKELRQRLLENDPDRFTAAIPRKSIVYYE